LKRADGVTAFSFWLVWGVPWWVLDSRVGLGGDVVKNEMDERGVLGVEDCDVGERFWGVEGID